MGVMDVYANHVPSYCFDGLTIKSEGVTREYVSDILGTYKYQSMSNGRPLFKSVTKHYYFRWNTYNNWSVSSSKIGTSIDMYHKRCKEPNPADCDSAYWRVWTGKKWQ